MRCLVPLLAALLAATSAWAESPAQDKNGACLACHTDAGHLMQAVKPPPAVGEASCAAAPSRPAFLGAFVNAAFSDTTHGKIGCAGCHGGDATAKDATAAHKAMTPADSGCADCHRDIAAQHATSLHATVNGMAHALKLRTGEDNFKKLEPMWRQDCATCHTSCSDCHLTLPKAVGGGLIQGHTLFKRPPMEQTCAVCHGSRAGGEYLGHFDGVAPDVHFEAGMHCLDCHKNDLHGDGKTYTDRWSVVGRPLCTDCHPPLPNSNVPAHSEKHQSVSCQVCHAQPYQSCFGCHSAEEKGGYVRRADKKSLALKIGANTQPGYPYDVVTLRANPLARQTFDHFGKGLMPKFDNHPTWKTAAPHNIQRRPAQSRTCASCHDDASVWLRTQDLEDRGPAANRKAVNARGR